MPLSGSDLQLANEQTLVLPMRAAGVYPAAIFDDEGGLWSALVDGTGSCLMGVATEPLADGRATITLQALSPAHSPDRACARPRCRHRLIPGEGGTLHRICVYLPPDYGRKGPHPVIYLLPGLGQHEGVLFEDHAFVDAVDARRGIESGPGPILVGIDTRTPWGSAVLGQAETDWTRFLTRDLVTAIETEFETFRDFRHRVLIGHGTGGFNAMWLALSQPGVFGTVGASAPDALDLDAWLLSPAGAVKQLWAAWMRIESAVDGPGQMRSYGMSWSPKASGVDWPIDLDSGRMRYETLLRWLQQSPLRHLDRVDTQRALRTLEGRLHIAASRRDEFGLFLPARLFSERLTIRDIEHQFLPDDLGHFDAGPRLLQLIGLALARVNAPGPP